MVSCGRRSGILEELPQSYSLRELSSRKAPRNFRELTEWLTQNGRHREWDGKLYVASTAYWDQEIQEFRQKGCSPNYHAGWWSLACCKHDMRTGKPFRLHAKDLSVPTYIFTLGQIHRDLGQPLVSVARMTQYCFDTMDAYAEFLLNRNDARLLFSRLTREHKGDGQLGWRFGDCHADATGTVDEPYSGHVHHASTEWRDDINGMHMILASDEFLLWEKPAFVASTTQKQSRYGKDINQSNFSALLSACNG